MVHDSAMHRFGRVVPPATTPYAPQNLAEYLQRNAAAAGIRTPTHTARIGLP